MLRYFDVGEVKTSIGRAIVEERYRALRRQVPVIYLLALVNLGALQIATTGMLTVGFNPPTALAVCAAVRVVQWLGTAHEEVSHVQMLKRLRQTCAIAAFMCLLICIWCLRLLQFQDPTAELTIILLGSLTAIGTAYGLSSFPVAARLPLIVLSFPLAGRALLSDNPFFVSAALSLSIVSLLILRLLNVHNKHFTDLVRARARVLNEQERAEASHQRATEAATTDFLTGLPNRRAFMAALDEELANRAGGCKFGLALVDLDRFKPINDTFGHGIGDELLRVVADRLKGLAGEEATVARLGGDEFAVLLPHMDKTVTAEAFGKIILAAINQPAEVKGRQFPVSACCGIALSRRGKLRAPTQVLAHADIALYQAKALSPGRLAIFEPRMGAPRRRRTKIERALQLSTTYDDVHLVYQPIFDLRTGRIIAQEALARWTDRELGDISPAEFIPIAEQLDVIGRLSDTLLNKAIAEAALWPSDIRLSFNLSAVQLCSPGAAEVVMLALKNGGLPPERLQVEVTETSLLADFQKARDNLLKLRSAGVSIVLDDFGAGYASVSYLREIQFDQIKLDGSLTTAAQTDQNGQCLLAAVIGLCEILGVPPVAEHIETEEQLKLLLRLGCGAGQGYWLRRPMPADFARQIRSDLSFLPRGAVSSAA